MSERISQKSKSSKADSATVETTFLTKFDRLPPIDPVQSPRLGDLIKTANN